MSESEDAKPDPGTKNPARRLIALLVLVLVGIIGWKTLIREDARPPANRSGAATNEDTVGKKVFLTVDFGDGNRSEFPATAWFDGMTAADQLAAAGDFKLAMRGTEESALLTGIDAVANEGAGGRNWMYKVNDQMADRSFAIYKLQPGDRVLWTFGEGR